MKRDLLLVKLTLNKGSNVLLNVVLLHCLGSAVNRVLLHLLGHVGVLDDGLSVGHLAVSLCVGGRGTFAVWPGGFLERRPVVSRV